MYINAIEAMAKILATFRIEEEDWQAFKDLADSRGSNASSELIKYVLGCLGRLDSQSIQIHDIDSRINERISSRIEAYQLEINEQIAQLRQDIESYQGKLIA